MDMRRGGKRKTLGSLAGLVLLFGVMLGGCEKLMEKEAEEGNRTKGEEVYSGFDEIGLEYGAADVVKGGGLVCDQTRVEDGRKNWEAFMQSVEEKKPARIRIMQKITEENVFYKDVIYNGKNFRMIISVSPEEYDFTYPYLLKLEGRRTKESRKSILLILTEDAEVPFEDIIESESRQEVEKPVDYQLIFR